MIVIKNLKIIIGVISLSAQTLMAQIPTLQDTNQTKYAESLGVKIVWVDCFVSQRIVTVTTNWTVIGTPVEIRNFEHKVVARRITESSNIITNTVKKVTIDGQDYIHLIKSELGPLLQTRSFDIPTALTEVVTIPLRQQR